MPEIMKPLPDTLQLQEPLCISMPEQGPVGFIRLLFPQGFYPQQAGIVVKYGKM